MKNLLIPIAFLVFATAGMMNKGHAQVSSVSRPTKSPVYSYCDENRFENYVRLATAMRDYVTPATYSDLYIPLKMKASKAKITMKNYGALSGKTHASVLDIVNFVEAHEGEFGALWEVEAFFAIAQDLMDMTQALSRDLE